MKKKLIAALTSAAMVATMVPATAFAGTAVVTADNTPVKAAATVKAAEDTSVSIELPSYTTLQDSKMAQEYQKIAGEKLNAQVNTPTASSDGVVKLSGTLPYVEDYWAYGGWTGEDDPLIPSGEKEKAQKLVNGNYMAITLNVDPGSYGKWAYGWTDEGLVEYEETAGTNVLKLKNDATTATEILKVTGNKELTFTIYYGKDLEIENPGSYNNGTGATIKESSVEKTEKITIDKSALTLQTKDQKDIANVKALVSKIPALEQITANDANTIKAAAEAYEKCSSAAKRELTAEYDTITAAQDKLASLTDSAKAQDIIKDIKALTKPITEDIVDNYKTSKIDPIKTAYNELTDTQKALVTNYSDLEDAEAAIFAVTSIKDNRVNVTAATYANGTAQKAVKTIETAYNKLSNSAKEWVGNYSIYTDMTKAIAAFDKEVADADVVFAKVADMLGKVEVTQTSIDQAKAIAQDAQDIIDEWGSNASVLLKKLKNGNDTTLTNLNNEIKDAETQLKDQATADIVIQKLKALPAPADITINNMYEVKAAELAWNDDNPGAITLMVGSPKSVKDLVNEAFNGNAGAVVKAAVDALKEELKTAKAEDIVAAYKAIVDKIPAEPTLADEELIAIVKALAAELDGSDGDSYVEANVSDVIKADTTFKNAKETMNAAVAKINNIKTANEDAFTKVKDNVQSKFYPENPTNSGKHPMKEITASDRQDIEAARAAYDALTDDQKAYDDGTSANAVKVYDETGQADVDKTVKDALEAVEKALAQIDADAANRVAANALHKEITALMPSADLTLEDQIIVEEVKADFDAADKGVKDLLATSAYDITDGTNGPIKAETALNNAVDQINKLLAKEVMDQIDKLTAPDATSKTSIDDAITAAKNARDAYAALAAEQQAKVTNLNKLESVEASISEAKVTYTNTQLEAASKIDPSDMTEAEAAQLAEAKDLMDTWLTEEENAKLNADTLKAFNDTYNKYEEISMDLANARAAAITAQTYTGKAIEPEVVLSDIGGKTIDTANYHVEYKNNVNAGKATIVVTGENGYTGRQEIEFTINPASLTNATITVANQTYTGSALKPAITVKVGDNTVAAGDYTVAYSNNTNAGTATVTVTGKDNYTGTATKTFTIAKANIKGAKVTGVANRYYTGKARTQAGLKVAVAGKALNKSDYKVAYKNNKNVGKATLTITGQGNYTGTITKTFIVKPRKVASVKVTKGKKRVTVRYKKQNGARYQIYYKTAGSKAKTVKTTAVKRTIKKLKSGKTYTIKVRAYKKIGSKTYYGKYSAAKKVRVR
ncbi:fibronectin type III domain-containing protein [Zhenpiania hominis]|uniref:Fibronectin type III domain-containing protein n=1 Tax=Zhenpiania hominis TaxID=2763644 RepID=A0A923SR43_9FIRM|nr:fibronectin type III domain-containing protein [Zhenpiania hominis]MBC6680276.1 fibronectin type III domain-containing protein [Zhenpiania hominis]